MSARCASVSTFWTSVGRPPRPRSESRDDLAAGAGMPRSIQCTTALASPATNRSAAAQVVTWTRSKRTRRRSAMAAPRISRTLRCATITASVAPTISAARTAPSRTRCGDLAISTLSLPLAGSPSVPFPITTGARPAATAASLSAVGNPAPPRPVSPARSTSAISAGRSRRPGREHGDGPYRARCPARLAGPDAAPGGSRRGSSPGCPVPRGPSACGACVAARITAASSPEAVLAGAGPAAGGRGRATGPGDGRDRRSRPPRRSPTRPLRPTRSAGRCLR